ncbi:hypothetical protein [Candidatus Tisiphia endosymbiont of Nemotelus uliginosus]|uniref:hypothetical protein n=1 Tax=Candidatus Tisiphia endosymbiont of Nemotelus uliginosus TaxID=3077926 RepID=UPI0035C92375
MVTRHTVAHTFGGDNRETNTPTNLDIQTFKKLNVGFTEIFLCVDQIDKTLKNAKQNGKLPSNTLQELEGYWSPVATKILNFQTEWSKLDDKSTSAHLKDACEKINRQEYDSSPIGRLAKFAAEQLEKLKEPINKKFASSLKAIQENEFLNALKDVIKEACNAVFTIVKNAVKTSVENAIAIGKLAESVKKFGEVMTKTVVGKAPSGGLSR